MVCVQRQWKIPTSFMSSGFLGPGSFLQNQCRASKNFKCYRDRRRLTGNNNTRRGNVGCGWLPPPAVDPWAPNIDSASIAPQLFAASLFPYLGFLYFITKSKSAPKLTLVGFYFLLAFVGATNIVLVGFLASLGFDFLEFPILLAIWGLFGLLFLLTIKEDNRNPSWDLRFEQRRCIMVLPCQMLAGYMVGLSLFSL